MYIYIYVPTYTINQVGIDDILYIYTYIQNGVGFCNTALGGVGEGVRNGSSYISRMLFEHLH